MKNNFRGWTSVYVFTFNQITKRMSFRIVTAIITILIFGALILTNVLVAKPDKDEKLEKSRIEKIYILDNSGLESANYKDIVTQLGKEQFGHIEFEMVADTTRDAVIEKTANSPKNIAVFISFKEPNYEIEAVIPANSEIKTKDAQQLLGLMSSGFETNKLMQAGLSVEQLTTVLKPTETSFVDIGESTNEIIEIIKIVAPMAFSFILYFMLLLHGQSVGKAVSAEKSTKLMDTLLISVHPYALITGKILAITSMAIAQFVTWMVTAIAGLYAGNAVAHMYYPSYENSVITLINFLRDNIGKTAFTLPSIILAIVFLCIGFLFYCVIFGIGGALVSKPEDVSSTQALFQMPMIFSWLISYMAPVMDNDGLVNVLRYIPFTSPFIIPVDLITGTIGLLEGVISLVILLIISILFIVLAAKIYKGLVLYTGQKLNFKTLVNVLKASN